MDAALGWLGDVMRWLGDLLPRWEIIRSTEGGVSFRRGKPQEFRGPRILWWWPAHTELETIFCERQSLNLPSQTLTTKDGVPVTVSSVVVFEVASPLTVLTIQDDMDDTARDLSMAAIRNFVCSWSFEKLRSSWEWADKDLKRKTAEVLAPYGLKVLDARITDFAKTRVITVVAPDGGGNYLPDEEDD